MQSAQYLARREVVLTYPAEYRELYLTQKELAQKNNEPNIRSKAQQRATTILINKYYTEYSKAYKKFRDNGHPRNATREQE